MPKHTHADKTVQKEGTLLFAHIHRECKSAMHKHTHTHTQIEELDLHRKENTIDFTWPLGKHSHRPQSNQILQPARVNIVLRLACIASSICHLSAQRLVLSINPLAYISLWRCLLDQQSNVFAILIYSTFACKHKWAFCIACARFQLCLNIALQCIF